MTSKGETFGIVPSIFLACEFLMLGTRVSLPSNLESNPSTLDCRIISPGFDSSVSTLGFNLGF